MLVIALRLVWFPCPGGRGAIRVRDHAFWETALWCKACLCLGYNHDDIDAVLEADRLGVRDARRVADCGSCGAPTCDACADPTGTMCRRCHARGPGA